MSTPEKIDALWSELEPYLEQARLEVMARLAQLDLELLKPTMHGRFHTGGLEHDCDLVLKSEDTLGKDELEELLDSLHYRARALMLRAARKGIAGKH